MNYQKNNDRSKEEKDEDFMVKMYNKTYPYVIKF